MPDKELNPKAIVFALMSFLFLSSLGLFIKFTHHYNVPLAMILFIQFSSAFVFSLILVARYKFVHVKTHKHVLHFLRAAIGLSAFFLYVLALTKIPLVNATLLQNTAPIFIPFLAYMILKSAFDNNIWLGISIGFAGVIFIIQPFTSGFVFNMGDIYALLAGICLAFVFVILKKLSATEHYLTILFYFTLISSLIMTPFALASWESIPLPAVLYIVGAGAMVVFYQITLQYAYKYSDPVKLSPFTYSAVIYAGIFDWIFFGLFPNILTLIGIFLVCIGGVTAIKFHGLKHGQGKHSWH